MTRQVHDSLQVRTRLDDGFYDWQIPADDSADCLVKVSSEAGGYEDESDNFFTIIPAGANKPNLRIVSISPSQFVVPSVNDSITVEVTVRNTGRAASGVCFVDLFYDRSAAPAVGEMGNQTKPVSGLLPDAEATVVFAGVSAIAPGIWNMYAIVDTQKYVDEANEADNVAGPVQVGWETNVPSLRILDPNGGENLEVGKACLISWEWTPDPGADVHMEISRDGGVTWAELVSQTPNDGAYSWAVTGPPSSTCRIRVSNIPGDISDGSDAAFAILPAGAGALDFLGGGCPGRGALHSPGSNPWDGLGLLAPLLVLLASAALLRRTGRRRGRTALS